MKKAIFVSRHPSFDCFFFRVTLSAFVYTSLYGNTGAKPTEADSDKL